MKNNTRKYVTIITISGLSFVLWAFVTYSLDRVPIAVDIVMEAQKINYFEFTPDQTNCMLYLPDNHNKPYHKLPEAFAGCSDLLRGSYFNTKHPSLNF